MIYQHEITKKKAMPAIPKTLMPDKAAKKIRERMNIHPGTLGFPAGV
jgi:hypothetical protein